MEDAPTPGSPSGTECTERTMRAAVAEAFGPPEALAVRSVPMPVAGHGEVLVRVYAAGVNPVDAGIRTDGTWAGIQPPLIPGGEASGVIEAVGPGVDSVARGDDVFYLSPFRGNAAGAYAEYQAV